MQKTGRHLSLFLEGCLSFFLQVYHYTVREKVCFKAREKLINCHSLFCYDVSSLFSVFSGKNRPRATKKETHTVADFYRRFFFFQPRFQPVFIAGDWGRLSEKNIGGFFLIFWPVGIEKGWGITTKVGEV